MACLLAVLVAGCTVGSDPDDIPELDEEVDPPEPPSTSIANCDAPPPVVTQGGKVSVSGRTAWVHFTNPTVDVTKTNITDEVVRLIWSVPQGGTIHAAIHSLSLEKVSHALLCAQKKRGVTVKVVEDGGIATPRSDMSTAAKQLEGLGENLTYCGQGTDRHWSCIRKDQKAIMHTKLFLFSTATAPDGTVANDVVWFGSANMTKATGENTFNNTVTVYGDRELFTGALGYYRDLQKQQAVAGGDYFHNGGKVVAPTAKLFLSPSPQADLWRERLDEVIPGPDCAIIVAHAYILEARSIVVQKLRDLANRKCSVKIVGALKDTPAEQEQQLSPSLMSVINGNPANGIPKIEMRLAKTHDKYMVITARFGNEPNVVRNIVFTGSHNLTGPANNRNDELLARLDGPEIAWAFVLHWTAAWNAGKPVN